MLSVHCSDLPSCKGQRCDALIMHRQSCQFSKLLTKEWLWLRQQVGFEWHVWCCLFKQNQQRYLNLTDSGKYGEACKFFCQANKVNKLRHNGFKRWDKSLRSKNPRQKLLCTNSHFSCKMSCNYTEVRQVEKAIPRTTRIVGSQGVYSITYNSL